MSCCQRLLMNSSYLAIAPHRERACVRKVRRYAKGNELMREHELELTPALPMARGRRHYEVPRHRVWPDSKSVVCLLLLFCCRFE